MPNFSIRFAMRCTEQQWNAPMKDGYCISDKLKALGYDLSDLRFYPNKPFVATYYKNTDGLIGTTNTPYKDDRTVIDEWNGELFFALSCQQIGKDVSIGEFFTNKDKAVLRCHEIAGNWLRHNKPNGKNNAYPINLTHKSTYEELVYHFTQKIITAAEIEDQVEIKKRGSKLVAVDIVADKEAILEVAMEIVGSDEPKTFEEMKTIMAGHKISVQERGDDEVLLGIIDMKLPERTSDSERLPFPEKREDIKKWLHDALVPKKPEQEVVNKEVEPIKGSEDQYLHDVVSINRQTGLRQEYIYEGTDLNSIKTSGRIQLAGSPRVPNNLIIGSMTFPQLLQWFASNDKVVYGWVKNSEIYSEIKTIQYISREGVKLEEDQNETGFEFIFQDQESFLNYALSIIKNKVA